LPNDEIVVR